MIGVAKTTIAGYEKNREPTAAQLGAIADALGTDVGYLLQDEVSHYKHNKRENEREELLLSSFRELNEEGQDTALNVVQSLAASGQFKKMGPAGLGEKAG